MPNVGTTAACLFTRNVILQRTVPDLIALTMLSKLPMSVRHPTELLLKDMQELLKKDESISIDVRKASILCFYTLVHKTYRNEMKTTQRKLYLQELMEELKGNTVSAFDSEISARSNDRTPRNLKETTDSSN